MLRFVSQEALEAEGPPVSEEGIADWSEGAMGRGEEGGLGVFLFIELS